MTKPMSMMQKIFNRIVKHLLTQNEQAKSKANYATEGSCKYHTKDGLRCAVGCLIPWKVNTEDIEGTSVDSFVMGFLEDHIGYGLSVDPDDDVLQEMLQDCQNVHDCNGPEYWRRDLENVAHDYSLDFPKINEVVN